MSSGPSGKVLVLGANGFIGRALCTRLASSGRNVLAGVRHAPSWSTPGVEVAMSRFLEPGDFRAALSGVATVVHAASATTPSRSAAQPGMEIACNLAPLASLLEALQDFPDVRLVYLSSGGTVYGDGVARRESDPLCPRSFHGAAKVAAEQFIQAWCASGTRHAIALRPANVFGPGQSPKSGFAIIPTAFGHLLTDTPLTVWGDGGIVRDYLYIDDFLEACMLACDSPIAPGMRVFNVGSGEGTGLLSLLDLIESVAKKRLQRNPQPRRKGDVASITLDVSAIRDELGWLPRTTLRDGLHSTWEWIRAAG